MGNYFLRTVFSYFQKLFVKSSIGIIFEVNVTLLYLHD